MPYIQHDQEIEIDEPTKSLLLGAIEGEENLSEPYSYKLTLYSERKSISPSELLGKPVTALIHDGELKRPIHGRVRRFAQGIRVGDLTAYDMEIVPWLWMLSLSSDCHHWQEKNVLDITKEVFERLGQTDYRISCTKTYPKREFCVQYNETDLDFVSRLWEEEGIYYFFVHEEHGHKLVLADDPSAVATGVIDKLQTAQASDVDSKAPELATGVRVEHNVHPQKFLLHDFNFENVGALTSASAVSSQAAAQGERFAYQGPPFDPPNSVDGIVRAQIEREEAMRTVAYGTVANALLQAGTHVTLNDAPSSLPADVHVVGTRLTFRMATYTSGESEREVSTAFVAIPRDTPFRPSRKTPKPRVQGIQTAIVVGETGEEITVDKYSRIRVRFHWDRQSLKSCWVRLSSTWAGAGRGFVQVPRVDDEVVVDFLNGDPDKPIIIGSLYNAGKMPPLNLPTDKVKSGFKSRSMERGAAYNELWFNDTKDSEKISLYAGKDYDTVVKNDCTRTVQEGKDDLKVEKGSQTIVVHKDRNATIETGNDVVKVSQGDMQVEVTAGNVSVKAAAGKVTIEATTAIELKVGANSIKIDQSGVQVSGTTVKVEGQATTQIKAPMTQVNGDGMLTLKGGVTMVN